MAGAGAAPGSSVGGIGGKLLLPTAHAELPAPLVHEALLRLAALPWALQASHSAAAVAATASQAHAQTQAQAGKLDGLPQESPAQQRRRRRVVAAALFRQLEPSYGGMGVEARVGLLEAAGRLTEVLGPCPRLPTSPSRPPAAVAAAAAKGEDALDGGKPIGGRPIGGKAIGGGGAGSGGGAPSRLPHPAVPLVHALMGEGRARDLFDPPLAAPPSTATFAAAAPTPTPAPAALSPRFSQPSLPVRVLASLSRLRLRDPRLLGQLLQPLAARRRPLPPADAAGVLVAAVALRPVADELVPWGDVLAGLAAQGALAQLPPGELVRLAMALRELGLTVAGHNEEANDPRHPAESSSAMDEPPSPDPGLDLGLRLAEEAAAAPSLQHEEGAAGRSWRLGGTAGRGGGGGGGGSGGGNGGGGSGGGEEQALLVALGRELGARAARGELAGGQLAQLAAAAVALGLRDQATLAPLLDAAAAAAPSLRPDQLSQLLCAAARAGCPHARLLDAASAALVAAPAPVNVRTLAVSAWAAACMGLPAPRLFGPATASALVAGIGGGGGGGAAPPPRQPPPAEGAAAAAAELPPLLRQHELANALWAFARQGARHDRLMAAALRRGEEWDAAGELPRRHLVKMLQPGNPAAVDPASCSMVLRDTRSLSAPELVQAAEALLPYCAQGGVLYGQYGTRVYEQLVHAATARSGELRPDACVSLLRSLSQYSSGAPPPGSGKPSPSDDLLKSAAAASPGARLDPRALLKLQQRLAPALAAGALAPPQLLELLAVLAALGARSAPLLPDIEQALLQGAVAAAAGSLGSLDEEQQQGRRGAWEQRGVATGAGAGAEAGLSGRQAAAALAALGALQRAEAMAELFCRTSGIIAPELRRMEPAAIALLLRHLGSAALRAQPSPSQQEARSEQQQRGHASATGRPAGPAAGTQGGPTSGAAPGSSGAAAALGPGLPLFLAASWAALSGPGRLEALDAKEIVDLVWGLTACGYDDQDTYDKLAARLFSRAKQLPGWSLARLAVALAGRHQLMQGGASPAAATGTGETEQGRLEADASASAGASGGGAASVGSPKRGAAGASSTAGGGAGLLPQYPELTERIAKYGTRELARPSSSLKPEAVAALAEARGKKAGWAEEDEEEQEEYAGGDVGPSSLAV
ncbi:hypothetical protein GPECTOR_14g269 [Gonium pectorale]|uniref:Uncharacterized protein n=1 Tax=Gonium pectorale TaxID=33097 RepID=A0A150GMF0_GONPE|nr:hypothetical protein GPECTOR_14g269 [Gonium pectorale]|eukprot:KXZ51029.1 hypothetical protein GPECTOR_14g269 [Gonium pectorale]